MTVTYVDSKPSIRSIGLNLILRLVLKPRFKREVGDVTGLRRFAKKVFGDRGRLPKGLNMSLKDNSSAHSVPVYEITKEGVENSEYILFYLHGGGFFLEIPKVHGRFIANLLDSFTLKGFKFKGVMPSYRLAPEHPFPAALDDAMAVYRGLIDANIDAKKIVIAGDSAGGCLTLVLLQQLKKAGLPLPACAVMSSPGTDLSGVLVSHKENVEVDPMFNRFALNHVNELYIGGSDELAKDARVSPLRGDFSGLPPLFFMVGSTEVLLDDSVKATEKARMAGVDARCDVWPSMPHCFALLPQYLMPEAKRGISDISQFILSHI